MLSGKTKRTMTALFLLLAMVLTLLPGNLITASAEESTSTARPFRELTGEELTAEMGAGWNLGNTFDGHTGFTPNETVWQNVQTTKELIKAVHDLGFNTIRIPVTWGTMIDDTNGYTIDEKWMSRIQDVVDYAIEQDMYVILNIHHDGAEQMGWLRIATENKGALCQKFAGVWRNIAERFKDYDEHLIFEAMNEVKGEAMTLAEENAVIMQLNQIFVNMVRGTGSNNAKRWLVVCGKFNYIDSLVNAKGGFELPVDKVENRIMLSVHCYSTWDFCGSESTQTTTYSLKNLQNINEKELSLLEQFTSQGIPVIVGEYGCINKNNPSERAFFVEGMNKIFKKYNLIGIYWDQGWYDRSQNPDYSFSIIDRETGTPIDKEVTDAILRGTYTRDGSTLADLVHNTEVNAITDLVPEAKQVTLTIGETYRLNVVVTPENTNDVVLYKTDDATVATVYNGMLRAKGIGETTITLFSQSGSVEKTVKVIVTAETAGTPCDAITTDADNYTLLEDEYVYLNAEIATEGCEAYLTYRSSDDSVATVSSIGKVLATGVGEAIITVTSSDGFVKEIPVSVTEPEAVYEITLALNVYYNDGDHGYYSNEVSTQTVTVTGNGQYTLTFNCATDLSAAAKNAGVSGLKNLTAIYIKDYAVTTGTASISPLDTCNIKYDKIRVNGTDMVITQTSPKSALKASGIFDTNDPINAWDGSAIEGVRVSNYTANFSDVSNPGMITVTFTLSNMKFTGKDEAEPPYVPEVTETPVPTEVPGVTETPAPTEIPKTTETPTPEPTEAPEGTVTPVPTEAPQVSLSPDTSAATDDAGNSALPWIVTGIVILAGVFAGVVIVMRKKK